MQGKTPVFAQIEAHNGAQEIDESIVIAQVGASFNANRGGLAIEEKMSSIGVRKVEKRPVSTDLGSTTRILLMAMEAAGWKDTHRLGQRPVYPRIPASDVNLNVARRYSW